jgi:hypothetical protein
MKRHGFSGGQRTHGQSDRQRAPVPSAHHLILQEFLKDKEWQEEWEMTLFP